MGGPGCWSLEEWHSKDGALKYFGEINDWEKLRHALSEEVGTHAAINVFEHFLEVLKNSGTVEEYQATIDKLRLFLIGWFNDLKSRGEVGQGEFLEFLYCCRTWKFPEPMKLYELEKLSVKPDLEGLDQLLIIQDAVFRSNGTWPPLE